MKKTLRKPENWQDFESLCKQLWGEIWKIPDKIKKNGRLGQDQAGVDIYGLPKGESNYWGIQCKGKDDYSNARLRETEIKKEIKKAKKFKPVLAVYIFATSANKDSRLEKIFRIIDNENQQNGSFEVLLYCWEDIVDLIEKNHNTFSWYLQKNGQKNDFIHTALSSNFKVSFNTKEDHFILNPILEKRITQFILSEKSDLEIEMEILSSAKIIINNYESNPSLYFPIVSNKINKSWCSFKLIMENTGSVVIEDWKLILKFIEGVAHLDNSNPLNQTLSTTTIIDDENKTITYNPLNNSPLVQKDNRYFEVSLLPELKSKIIIMEWELFARDFSKKKTEKIGIEPKFIEKIENKEVNKKSKIDKNKVHISYYIVDKEI